MRKLLTLTFALAASPALAAPGEYGFFSLQNTDFVVLLAFLVVLGILFWFRVPTMIAGLLDRRAEGIRRDLEEARAVRGEAEALLASFDRKRQEMSEQATRIVTQAREEAQRAAAQAREDAARSVERRLASAQEQIAAAEVKAVREVRDRAIAVAVAAAREVLENQLTPADRDRLVEQSIATVGQKLH